MLEAMYRVCGWQLGPDFEVQTAVGKIYFYFTVKEMRFFFFFFFFFCSFLGPWKQFYDYS